VVMRAGRQISNCGLVCSTCRAKKETRGGKTLRQEQEALSASVPFTREQRRLGGGSDHGRRRAAVGRAARCWRTRRRAAARTAAAVRRAVAGTADHHRRPRQGPRPRLRRGRRRRPPRELASSAQTPRAEHAATVRRPAAPPVHRATAAGAAPAAAEPAAALALAATAAAATATATATAGRRWWWWWRKRRRAAVAVAYRQAQQNDLGAAVGRARDLMELAPRSGPKERMPADRQRVDRRHARAMRGRGPERGAMPKAT
jgi:hypothetical protein